MTQSSTPINQLLQQAIAFHQRGQFKDAQAIYVQILNRQPDQFDALQLLGTLAAQTQNPAAAVELMTKALKINPRHAPTHNNRGLVLRELGQLDAAIAAYDKAIAIAPDYVDAYSNRGNALAELKQFSAAIASYNKAVAIRPDFAQAYFNRGNALMELNQLEAAVQSYDKAIEIQPAFAQAHCNRGNALKGLHRLAPAIASYQQAIAISPDYVAAHSNLGTAFLELGQFDAAVASYDNAIAIRPDSAEVYYNRGNALQELKQTDAAIVSYEKAIAIQPDFAVAHYNRGNALLKLRQTEAALASYDQAISLRPDYVEAHTNRGNLLAKLENFKAAIASYDQAISHNPMHAKAHSNRGNVLAQTRQFDAAIASFNRAIQIDPGYAEAYDNLGNALAELKRFDEAVASYDKAISLRPDFAEPHSHRGNALVSLKNHAAAIVSYERALRINPDFEFQSGMLQGTRMQLCDWQDFDQQVHLLEEKIRSGAKASPPFSALSLMDSSSVHRKCAETYVNEKFPPVSKTTGIARRAKSDRIRIGYYSSDYHNHPVAFLIAGLFELHDRDRFEVIAFSSGPNVQDDMRRRLMKSFDRFIDVRDTGDEEVARMSRDMAIDIAIDLSGFTADGRTGVFAHRAAPIQVNYLGYPGTMGAPYIDYIIADSVIIPPESRQHYSEKVVAMPESYQVNDRQRVIADTQFSREELGLPGTGFVFCCFNNNFKITPATFDIWMRVLKAVDGSVLWLFAESPKSAERLRGEAQKRGVPPERLVFANRVPLADHLARHRAADLFIDTLPYNAHTTGSDALWAGLPVLTLMGESFAARVAASLLNAVHLPELVTTTPAQYEALAIELATHPEKLAGIKRKLAENRLVAPLFDTARFARHIEAAYTIMMERYWADMPPDHIQILP